jgi:hypothetical protein
MHLSADVFAWSQVPQARMDTHQAPGTRGVWMNTAVTCGSMFGGFCNKRVSGMSVEAHFNLLIHLSL